MSGYVVNVVHPACSRCGADDRLLYEGVCFACLDTPEPVVDTDLSLFKLEGWSLDCPTCRGDA